MNNFDKTYKYIAIHQGKAWGLTEKKSSFIFELISEPQYGHSGGHSSEGEAIYWAADIGALVIDTKTQRTVGVSKEQKTIYKIILT